MHGAILGDITGTPAGLMGHGAYERKGKRKTLCTQLYTT